MRKAVGDTEEGLSRFLKRFPSLFRVTGNIVTPVSLGDLPPSNPSPIVIINNNSLQNNLTVDSSISDLPPSNCERRNNYQQQQQQQLSLSRTTSLQIIQAYLWLRIAQIITHLLLLRRNVTALVDTTGTFYHSKPSSLSSSNAVSYAAAVSANAASSLSNISMRHNVLDSLDFARETEAVKYFQRAFTETRGAMGTC